MDSSTKHYSNNNTGGIEPPAKKSRRNSGDDGDEETMVRQNFSDESKPAALKSSEVGNDDDEQEVGDDNGGSLEGVTALLSFDALYTVMEYLSPRDLLNTAFTCKSLRDMLTVETVVKSALIHGGRANKSMEEIHALTSNHSIHVPSALRLLRISNGKRCEICNGCRVNHVRPGTGVFACWDCITLKNQSNVYEPHWRGEHNWRGAALTRPWKTTWVRFRQNNSKYTRVFNHPRVAGNQYGRNYYMLSNHLTDRSGERVGAIVLGGMLMQS